MNNKYDIVIIGAGPSGLAAAHYLSQKYSVVLIDKYIFPRNKTCGDGFAADSFKILKKLNLSDLIEEKGYICSSINFNTDSSFLFEINSRIITFKRELFDDLFLKSVIRNGVILRHGYFDGKINSINKEIRIILGGKSCDRIIARHIILATGANDSSIRHLFKNRFSYPDLMAIRGYYRSNWNFVCPKIFFPSSLPQGYVWFFPLGNGLFNTGCGCKINTSGSYLFKFLNDYIDNFNKSFSFDGEWISKPAGAFLRTNLSNINAVIPENFYLTGEALGTTFPFTGEGIGKAMESGILTAQYIDLLMKKGYDTKIVPSYNTFIKSNLISSYIPYRMANFIFSNAFSKKMALNYISNKKSLQTFISKVLDEKILFRNYSSVIKYAISKFINRSNRH